MQWMSFAAAVLPVFAMPGCGTVQEEGIAVDHRMGFLADSLRQPPGAPPGDFVLHPPAWARIHRDSLCLVVDRPDRSARFLYLDVILRDPRTGDSLAFGQTAFSAIVGTREVSCRPVRYLGGREAWQAPVEVELILKDFLDSGSAYLASRKLVVDPDFGQLDLQPFRVHFFPDRPGMEWLIEGAIESIGTYRHIRRLVSWTVLPDDPAGICYQDSVVRLQLHAMDCASGDQTDPDADLLRCSAAMDSALAAGSLDLLESDLCSLRYFVQLDSAILSNREDGYDADVLFGRFRATHHYRLNIAGYVSETRSAEGIGDYSYDSVDSAEGFRFESRILAVK